MERNVRAPIARGPAPHRGIVVRILVRANFVKSKSWPYCGNLGQVFTVGMGPSGRTDSRSAQVRRELGIPKQRDSWLASQSAAGKADSPVGYASDSISTAIKSFLNRRRTFRRDRQSVCLLD